MHRFISSRSAELPGCRSAGVHFDEIRHKQYENGKGYGTCHWNCYVLEYVNKRVAGWERRGFGNVADAERIEDE